MPGKIIKTLVVDTDDSAVTHLTAMIHDCCPEIEIIAVCNSIEQAKVAVNKFHPRLVFAETELPDGSGFELIKSLPEKNFRVVFITNNRENAIQAFRFSAIDYLVKPISEEMLLEAVRKTQADLTEANSINELKNYLGELNGKQASTLVVYNSKGFTVLKTEDIIYMEADGYCTNFYLLGKTKISSSRNLKFYVLLLPENEFMRVHHSFVINLNHVKGYNCQEEILLSENLSCSLSASHKTMFLNHFKHKK